MFSGSFWRNLSMAFDYFVVLTGRWTSYVLLLNWFCPTAEHNTNFPHVASRTACVVHSSYFFVIPLWRHTPGELSASTFFFVFFVGLSSACSLSVFSHDDNIGHANRNAFTDAPMKNYERTANAVQTSLGVIVGVQTHFKQELIHSTEMNENCNKPTAKGTMLS